MLAYQDILLRLLLAAFLGGVVGLDRERLEAVAGLRTHMLVCVGSALIMVVSAFGFHDILGTPGVILDPSRVAAQVVSGIGFLGAGTILFLRQEIIRGLTTAASLWTVAAVGLAVGGGLYLAAATATAIVVVILAIMKQIERRLFHRGRTRQLVLSVDLATTTVHEITAMLENMGISITEISMLRRDSPGADQLQIRFTRRVEEKSLVLVIDRLKSLAGVRDANLRL